MISSHRSQTIITQHTNSKTLNYHFISMNGKSARERERDTAWSTGGFCCFFLLLFSVFAIVFLMYCDCYRRPPLVAFHFSSALFVGRCLSNEVDCVVLHYMSVSLCACARWTLSFYYNCLSSHRKQFPNWNWNSRSDNGPAHHYSHTSLSRFEISISANLHLFFFSFYWLRLSWAVWLCTSSSDAIKTLSSLVH